MCVNFKWRLFACSTTATRWKFFITLQQNQICVIVKIHDYIRFRPSCFNYSISIFCPAKPLYLCSFQFLIKLLEQFCKFSFFRIFSWQLLKIFDSGILEKVFHFIIKAIHTIEIAWKLIHKQSCRNVPWICFYCDFNIALHRMRAAVILYNAKWFFISK